MKINMPTFKVEKMFFFRGGPYVFFVGAQMSCGGPDVQVFWGPYVQHEGPYVHGGPDVQDSLKVGWIVILAWFPLQLCYQISKKMKIIFSLIYDFFPKIKVDFLKTLKG